MKGPVPSGAKPKPIVQPRPSSAQVKKRAVGAAIGAAAGMLGGFFLVAFGLQEMLGVLSSEAIVAVGGLFGAVFGAFSLYWVPLGVDAALIVLYLLVADTPLMGRAAANWVRADPIPPSADAIVVLSASVNSDGFLNDQGVQRLLTGIALFQQGLAPRIFTTAVEERYADQVRSSTADQGRLIKMGGATAAWTSLTGAFNTRDEALQAAAHLPQGTHTVFVVTSPMHTRRACATFETVGFTVVCVPSREHAYVTWHPIHSSDRLAAFRDYAYERLGMIKYRAKGWLPKT